MSLRSSFLNYFNGSERAEDSPMFLKDLRFEIEDLIEDIDGGTVSARDRRQLQELLDNYCIIYADLLKEEVLRSVEKLTVSKSLREVLRLLEAIEKYQDRQDRDSEYKGDDTLLARAFKLSVRKNSSTSSEKDQSKARMKAKSRSDKDQKTKEVETDNEEGEEPAVARIIYVGNNGKYYQSRESAIKKGGGVKEAKFLYIRGTEILKTPVPESEKKRLIKENFDIDL